MQSLLQLHVTRTDAFGKMCSPVHVAQTVLKLLQSNSESQDVI